MKKKPNKMENHNFRLKPTMLTMMKSISRQVGVPLSEIIRVGAWEYAQRLYKEHLNKGGKNDS